MTRNKTLHRLLLRQVKKYLPEEAVETDPALRSFLQAINVAYNEYDRDRILYEQSLSLNDQEYSTVTAKLKEELQRKSQLEGMLLRAISKLQGGESNQPIDENKTVLELVNQLYEQIEHTKTIEQQLFQAKQLAEYANTAKSNFLSMMSHEIRTPLNAVIGLTHIMEAEDNLESYRENLETLKFSANNLNLLINDILDFSKIESGKLELEAVPFNLRLLVHEINKALSVSAQEKGNALTTEIDPEVPQFVLGDPLRLGQILTNLVSNACKFTHHGLISIKCQLTELEDGYACIYFSVKDSGIGIPKEKQKLIFDEFTQADNTVTRRYGGTGLGLVITKKLLQLFNAEIYVESEKGKGSNFFFTLRLPIAVPSSLKAPLLSSKYSEDRDLLGVRVLLVEDHPINIAVAKKIMQMWGIEVDTAENGQIAVEKYRTGLYDLILMDIQMPIMDGYTATSKIRSIDPNIPILALTASASLENQDRALSSGMNDYVTKPFHPQELRLKLCKHAQS